MMKSGNKYGARKTTTADGQKFDSVKELRRWGGAAAIAEGR